MKTFLLKNWLPVTGVIAGAVGGYLYWLYIGCDAGSCAITSKPLNSTAYGAVMGGLLLAVFQTKKEKS